MIDPLDQINANMPAAIGETSPDVWRNLMNFGLATMKAGATPGITTFGAIGEGGLSAIDQARQNAAARAQQQLVASEASKNLLGNQMQLMQLNLQRQAVGLPAVSTGPIGQIVASQPQTPQQNNLPMPSVSTSAGTQGSNPYGNLDAMTAGMSPSQKSAFYHMMGFGGLANSAADLWAKGQEPVTLSPGQTRFDQATGRIISSPHVMQAIDKSGQTSPTFVNQPVVVGGQPVGQMSVDQVAGMLPSNVLGGGQTASNMPITNLGPLKEKELSEFAQMKSDIADSARAADISNTSLEEMKRAADDFRTDASGNFRGNVQMYVQAVRNMLPGTEIKDDDAINAFTILKKNGGIVVRDALKSTYGSNISNLDMISTAQTLPGVDTPKGALEITASQLQGANDFNSAMNTFATSYNGEPNKNAFTKEVFKKVSPDVFIFNRYPEEIQKKIYDKLAASKNGQQKIDRLKAQMRYAYNNGLLPQQRGVGE